MPHLAAPGPNLGFEAQTLTVKLTFIRIYEFQMSCPHLFAVLLRRDTKPPPPPSPRLRFLPPPWLLRWAAGARDRRLASVGRLPGCGSAARAPPPSFSSCAYRNACVYVCVRARIVPSVAPFPPVKSTCQSRAIGARGALARRRLGVSGGLQPFPSLEPLSTDRLPCAYVLP